MTNKQQKVLTTDFNNPVWDKETIVQMMNDFVPPYLHPGQMPGFRDVVLETDQYMKETFLSKDEQAAPCTMVSVVVDVAAWGRQVGITLSEDTVYVIFLRKGQPWAYTFLSLLENIIRISVAISEGARVAESEEGVKNSLRQALTACRIAFDPRFDEFAEVVARAHDKIRTPVEE